MYGLSTADVATEESHLAPQTEYARSKVRAEAKLRELATDGFSPVFLRNGTIYGLSPRMRFDTVFNDLIGSAVARRKISVYSDGKPWRPVVHVEDVARAFAAVLAAPTEVIHNQAFNTGHENLNRQVIDLARIASETVPGCSLEVLAQAGADQRTYRADFTKFARAFPDFEFLWGPEDGAQRLYRELSELGLDEATWTDDRFTRLKWLRRQLDAGQLDDALRWTRAAA
jgi:nucleoside-diphosphate-sugar epimerase